MSKWYSHAACSRLAFSRLRQRVFSFPILGASVAAIGIFAASLAFAHEDAKVTASGESSILVTAGETSQAESSSVASDQSQSAELADSAAQDAAVSVDSRTDADAESRTNQSTSPFPAENGRYEAAEPKKLNPGMAMQAKGFPAEPVKFQGILVGKSTKQQLLEMWGNPLETVPTAEGTVLVFDIDPFQAVEALIGEGDIVSAIKIALSSPLASKQLAEQLSLNEIRPVTAYDESDQPLGEAFPERGVIFMYQPGLDSRSSDPLRSPPVSHVVLQRLDPLAFAMRANNTASCEFTQKITDLKTAVDIDPRCAHAHFLLAKIYLATGQADLADEAARTACEVDPENASYQLLHGRTQELLGRYDDAVLTVRAVLDRNDTSEIDKAQALHQMGSLASLGDVEIASTAIGFHTRAIEVADALANSANSKERRAAKQILVEAHMAIAEEIARQAFNQKVENLSLWIGRASSIAEEYIANDGGSVSLRLHIAQRTLAAFASFRPTLDPGPWVTEAEDSAAKLFPESDDELWETHVKWELGVAYFNALRVEHIRRETQTALKYGNKAVENLAQGASSRQAVHSSEQMIGQLYFQIGAVQAVHQLDHVKAAQWFDKAAPLLSTPQPKSELYSPRREGEMLVSMGVTYWQIGEHNRALELTQNGVQLVEEAVQAGILAKSTLSVPYGNLATMYQKTGQSASAQKYSQLARSVSSSDDPQHGDRMPNLRQTSNVAGTPNATNNNAGRTRTASMPQDMMMR